MASIQSSTDPRIAQPAMSLRDRLAGYLQNATSYLPASMQSYPDIPQMGVKQGTLAKDLMTPVENAPVVGQALAAEDVGAARQRGDWLSMGAAALGLMPGGGAEKHAAKEAVEAGRDTLARIRAYHGSPHDFDKFDLSKIGTGEGAQAYGHGLYFAENEKVAKDYRDTLSDKGWDATVTYKGEPLVAGHADDDYAELAKHAVASRVQGGEDPRGAIITESGEWGRSGTERGRRIAAEVAKLDPADFVRSKNNSGHLYEVDINADPEHFLDWDKPLSEQSEHVKRGIGMDKLPQKPSPEETTALFKLARERGVPAHTMPEYKALEARMDSATGDAWGALGIPPPNVSMRPEELPGSLYYQGLATGDAGVTHLSAGAPGSPEVSGSLQSRGIPGIKYLDQGSRANVDTNEIRGSLSMWQAALKKTPNDPYAQQQVADLTAKLAQAEKGGTRNYVVFDDKLISIVKKNGIAAALAAGLITESQAAELREQGYDE